jgi:hypothetical protein
MAGMVPGIPRSVYSRAADHAPAGERAPARPRPGQPPRHASRWPAPATWRSEASARKLPRAPRASRDRVGDALPGRLRSRHRRGDERVRLAARQAPGRTHRKLGQPAKCRDRGGGLPETEPRMNRQAAIAEGPAGVVTKKLLGRRFGVPAVHHAPLSLARLRCRSSGLRADPLQCARTASPRASTAQRRTTSPSATAAWPAWPAWRRLSGTRVDIRRGSRVRRPVSQSERRIGAIQHGDLSGEPPVVTPDSPGSRRSPSANPQGQGAGSLSLPSPEAPP